MVINFKSTPFTHVSYSATSFYVLALQYRNFLSFNIYLYSILRQIVCSRPSLESLNCIFVVKSLQNIFFQNFCSVEDMTTKFWSKTNVNIIKKMMCHITNSDFMSGNHNIMKELSKSSRFTEYDNFEFC